MTTPDDSTPLKDELDRDRSAVPVKLLYTVEEAALLLSLSRTSVFQLISDHRLAAVKIGGRRRIAHRALDDFVAELSSGAGPNTVPR
jgi:excisionase family DNA binding protein